MRYAFFLGCTIPVREIHYELSARKVAEEFGIELIHEPEFSCCGFPVKSVSHETALLMSARNLAIAEEKKLPIVTLCNGCVVTLIEANHEFKKNPELLQKINEKLEKVSGKKYKGTVKVKHFARVLYEDIGIEKIKEKIRYPLKGFRLAPHYGCHYFKPSEVYDRVDDPENPHTLDELIEALGATVSGGMKKNACCGGAILGIKEDVALQMSFEKLDFLVMNNTDAMVSICPFCSVMYDGNQKKIAKSFERELNLPVLYYTQLLGLALGYPPEELGFSKNRIKPKDFLTKFEKSYPSK